MRLRQALADHWLTGIHCDHVSKTDVATCFCAVWRSDPMPTVGGAVAAWIEHVMAHVTTDDVDVLRAQVELLREAHTEANRALRSAWSVAEREGRETNWSGHRAHLAASLECSHAAMNLLKVTPPQVPPAKLPG